MVIRKLFKFEGAHIVRGCSTFKCRSSIHGHSYKVEIKLYSNYLDNGQMVYDFGLLKQNIKDIVEMFDHAITLWSGDNKNYIEDMKKHSARWIELPVSPSAEQYSRVIYLLCERVLELTNVKNGEKEVKLQSVIVHETDTGYAEAFYEDAHSKLMGEIDIKDIKISDAIKDDFKDKELWEKLQNGIRFDNPTTV